MIRITGMNSGLDTERIIHELVRGQRKKVDTVKQNQTSTKWKMDAWQDLNNRALKLFNGTLGKMRFSTAYAQKTSKVSSNKASVVTGGTAVNGVQNLQINKLAKTGYLTGAQLDKSVTTNTTMSQLMGSSFNSGEDINFKVEVGDKTTNISLNGNSTVQHVVQQLRSAGLNANFDANNGRFFISSQTMGKDGDFKITANNGNGLNALQAMGVYEHAPSTDATHMWLKDILDSSGDVVPSRLGDWNDLVATHATNLRNADITARDAVIANRTSFAGTMADKLNEYKDWLINGGHGVAGDFPDETSIMAKINDLSINSLDDDIKATAQAMKDAWTQANTNLSNFDTEISTLNTKINGSYQTQAEDLTRSQIEFAKRATSTSTASSAGMTRIDGDDAEIVLNGATFTSNTNVFTINGLTITANQTTLNPTTGIHDIITITTEDDTQGIYNMIKDFIKEYNALINEMDRLFNAPSARDYRPLTDEQKDSMSDREIDEWEKRIKDSLLRRDSSLFNISNAMKNAMMGGVAVGDKTLHLSHFGIGALDFFLAPLNEKNALFIDGDEDSAHTSGKANRLKEMIASDPKTVMDFFIGLSRNLHGAMDKILLDRNADFKSVNTIYNDKQLKREYDNFNAAIARQEARLTSMEDKYYRQFSRMEVALAKMQSSQNAVTGLLGMSMMGNRR